MQHDPFWLLIPVYLFYQTICSLGADGEAVLKEQVWGWDKYSEPKVFYNLFAVSVNIFTAKERQRSKWLLEKKEKY